MDVTPVFADSLGAKSFCFRVDTDDTSILIDPGAAPFPKDHPTMSEDDRRARLAEAREAIADAAEGVRHVVITHWHGDHYTAADEGPDFDGLYGGRVLWVKDPRRMINPGQAKKAHRFFEQLVDRLGGDHEEGELPRPAGTTVRAADGKQVAYRDTMIRFSRPLPHGEKGSGRGYVLGIAVDDGAHVFVASSDVQGPASDAAEDWIRARDPTHLALDGPPSYLIGRHGITENAIQDALDRGEQLLADLAPAWAVYDHHLCREPGFRDRCPGIWDLGVQTVSEVVDR